MNLHSVHATCDRERVAESLYTTFEKVNKEISRYLHTQEFELVNGTGYTKMSQYTLRVQGSAEYHMHFVIDRMELNNTY